MAKRMAYDYRQFESPKQSSAPQRDADQRQRSRRRPAPQAAGLSDFLPMVGIVFVAAVIGVSGIVYLTPFARLTAHGNRLADLDQQIVTVQNQKREIAGEITRLQSRDYVEREAQRLGLVRLPAAEATPLPSSDQLAPQRGAGASAAKPAAAPAAARPKTTPAAKSATDAATKKTSPSTDAKTKTAATRSRTPQAARPAAKSGARSAARTNGRQQKEAAADRASSSHRG